MIPLYNPDFLKLYHINILNLGMDDLFTVIGLGIFFAIYILLTTRLFPDRYMHILQIQAMRDVQKAKYKREYIEEFEKII